MKRLLFLAVLFLSASRAFAVDLQFDSGFIFRSEYEAFKGRAGVTMTGNPGYVLITIDFNKCYVRIAGCEAGNKHKFFTNALYYLKKVSWNSEKITFEAVPVPLTDLAEKTLSKKEQHRILNSKITIEANLNPERFSPSVKEKLVKKLEGNDISDVVLAPKDLKMTVKYAGDVYEYHLNRVSRLILKP